MVYYNQNNYANIPYAADGYPNATVKSGGCGVVCASMVVENLTGTHFPPDQSAQFAIKKRARVSGGTDMKVLANALCAEFGLTVKTSNAMAELLSAVGNGAIAIANTGGDRAGHMGVFSNGGHYVVVYGVDGEKLQILDPGLYSGKYNKQHRKAVIVTDNTFIKAPASLLDGDCANRAPRYYIFKKTETKAPEGPSEWAKEAWEKATQKKILDGTNPQGPLTREQMAVVLDRLKLLED